MPQQTVVTRWTLITAQVLLLLLLFTCVPLLRNNIGSIDGELEEKKIEIKQEKVVVKVQCQAAPKNRSLHVVVGAYKYGETEGGVSLEKNNYLWNMGLTNARIFWYRKTRPEIPPKTLQGPCNVTMEERIITPNYGQEAPAFLDHIIEFYHDPPEALMFLHGHLGRAWHSTCEATFSGMIGYYKYAMNTNETALDAVIGISDQNNVRNIWGGRRRRLKRERNNDTLSCNDFLDRALVKHNMTPDPRDMDGWFPCCSNGIFPFSRILRYPIGFYKDWLQFMLDETNDQHMTSRFCFEFIIFPLYARQDEMKVQRAEMVEQGWIQNYETNASELESCTKLPVNFGLRTNITFHKKWKGN